MLCLGLAGALGRSGRVGEACGTLNELGWTLTVALGLGLAELLGTTGGHVDSCGTLLVHLGLGCRLVLSLGLEMAIALGLVVLVQSWPGWWSSPFSSEITGT